MREAAEMVLALVSMVLMLGFVLGMLSPKWVRQKGRGGVAKFYGLGTVACLVVVGLVAEPVERVEAGPVPPAEAVAEEPAEPSVEETLRGELADVLGRSNRDAPRLREVSVAPTVATVEWGLNDNLTAGLTRAGARRDMVRILETLAKSGAEFEMAIIRGTASMCDVMGNCQETLVIVARYTRATLQQVNWDNFLMDNVFRIAEEGVTIHPELR